MEAYMNTKDEFTTTYFYWESNNGKPILKSKKCKYLENIGEVFVVPFQKMEEMKAENCPIFAVRTYESAKKVELSYFYKMPSEWCKTPYKTVIDETEPLLRRELFFSISDGTFGIASGDIFPPPLNFDVFPDQVQTFCFKELLRLISNTSDIKIKELLF